MMTTKEIQDSVVEYGSSHDTFTEEEIMAYIQLKQELITTQAILELAQEGKVKLGLDENNEVTVAKV